MYISAIFLSKDPFQILCEILFMLLPGTGHSTLIGRGQTRLGCHWSIPSECWYYIIIIIIIIINIIIIITTINRYLLLF